MTLGADLILFPELTLTPFFPQYQGIDRRDEAVSLSHVYISRFQEVCKAEAIYAIPNFYLREKEKNYDASILIDRKGKIAGIQKMVHIAQAEQFYEQDYYTPSDEGFLTFETDFGRIGIVVCFDRHYPESIRTEALKGAELILIPTANTKAEPLTMFAWEIRVQAFQNGIPIAMCNRSGREDAMEFAGQSMVTDENGNLILMAGEEKGLFLADIDLRPSASVRKQNYTTLRRTDFYL